ncbi:hypothetical protein GHO41_07345 [Pseudomonas sp. FSL R10-0399]|uniref:hypothetical protein n=1 Tax=Pseudomonas sp. FSL R10-0399 TaxID=2662194 RepID=UPI001295888C|nr:hypothetical protein [Pseudomonas sp. FSL R10-0399]MQT57163.1 hypothetical protein [Pseudomonas sp. FSL R10-0399]
MSYYWVKYSDRLPEQFGGLASGPLIRIRPKYKDDTGLIEHEKTHVRQWYAAMAIGFLLSALLTLLVSNSVFPLFGLAPLLHQLLYKFVRPYRCWCEVKAYRKQIAIGGYLSNDFAVKALIEKYYLKLSADEARALLFD